MKIYLSSINTSLLDYSEIIDLVHPVRVIAEELLCISRVLIVYCLTRRRKKRFFTTMQHSKNPNKKSTLFIPISQATHGRERKNPPDGYHIELRDLLAHNRMFVALPVWFFLLHSAIDSKKNNETENEYPRMMKISIYRDSSQSPFFIWISMSI